MQKRRYGRVRARGVASHLRAGEKLTTGLAVENLSMGGAFIRTSTPLMVGSLVSITLVRPGLNKGIQVSGTVVSNVPTDVAQATKTAPGMGVAFQPYPAEVSDKLMDLLMALADRPGALQGDRPTPTLRPIDGPVRTVPPMLRPVEVSVPETSGLVAQVNRLLTDNGKWQDRVTQLERENLVLQQEVQRLKVELTKKK